MSAFSYSWRRCSAAPGTHLSLLSLLHGRRPVVPASGLLFSLPSIFATDHRCAVCHCVSTCSSAPMSPCNIVSKLTLSLCFSDRSVRRASRLAPVSSSSLCAVRLASRRRTIASAPRSIHGCWSLKPFSAARGFAHRWDKRGTHISLPRGACINAQASSSASTADIC